MITDELLAELRQARVLARVSLGLGLFAKEDVVTSAAVGLVLATRLTAISDQLDSIAARLPVASGGGAGASGGAAGASGGAKATENGPNQPDSGPRTSQIPGGILDSIYED